MMNHQRARRVIISAGVWVALLVSHALSAQVQTRISAAPRVPVLHPTRISVIAEFQDSGRGDIPLGAEASPNGRLIVYGTDRADLTMYNTVSHTHTVLVTGPVHGFNWGPKGDMLALQAHPGPLLYRGKELGREPSIYTIRIDSLTGEVLEPPHLVAKVRVNHSVFVSPDEQTIAFAQSYGWYVSTLSVVPAAGGVPRVLATAIEVHGIRWSPDGRWLFYDAFRNSSSSRTEYRISAAGGTPEPLFESTHDPISVGQNCGGIVDPWTRRLIARYDFPADVTVAELEWRKDLIAVRYVAPQGLRVLNASDGTVRDVVDSTTPTVSAPQWAQDGRLVAFVRDSERTELLVQNADGTDARRLRVSHASADYWNPPDLNSLRVSPDGRYAAFVGVAGGYQTIELVDLVTGRQRTLARVTSDFGDGSSPEGMGIGPLAWRIDSKSLCYLRDIGTEDPSVHEVTITGADRRVRPLPNSIYGRGPFCRSWYSRRQPGEARCRRTAERSPSRHAPVPERTVNSCGSRR
jgi:WD40-like Beta Propeller Repeat